MLGELKVVLNNEFGSGCWSVNVPKTKAPLTLVYTLTASRRGMFKGDLRPFKVMAGQMPVFTLSSSLSFPLYFHFEGPFEPFTCRGVVQTFVSFYESAPHFHSSTVLLLSVSTGKLFTLPAVFTVHLLPPSLPPLPLLPLLSHPPSLPRPWRSPLAPLGRAVIIIM